MTRPDRTVVPGRLAGRIALITGAGRGQGAAHARRFAAEGAAVVLTDVLDDDGEKVAAELAQAGHDVHYRRLDVADPASWEAARTAVDERFGKLDILVNNAGIIHETTIADEDLAAWTRLLSVNLTGVFLGLQTMLPLLKNGTNAAVVNTSSVYGPSGAIGYAAYGASKSGVLGLTRTAALEWADFGIRVNALLPGGVLGAMNEGEHSGGVLDETPLRRRAHVDELASAVAFLVSDDASFVTGTELVVDGGFRTR